MWKCLPCMFNAENYVWRGLVLESEVAMVSKRLKLWLYPPFIASHIWFFALLLLGYVFEDK